MRGKDFLSKSWRWAPDFRVDRIGAGTSVVEIERKEMALKMWCMQRVVVFGYGHRGGIKDSVNSMQVLAFF